MERREFITLVVGTAAAWPLAARAQQPAMPAIGYLNTRSAGEDEHLLAAFHQGLKETGYVESPNIAGRRAKTIDCRPWRPIWFAVKLR